MASFLGLQPEQVLLTNGVDEAIHLVCEAYLEPEDDALIVVPTFAMYQICAAATGARVISIPADEDFRFPTAKVMAHTTAPKTRLIAIANPNNPTGAVASAEDLLLIARSAPQAAVLVDEAYFEFHGESLLDMPAGSRTFLLREHFPRPTGWRFQSGGAGGRGDRCRPAARLLALQRERSGAGLPAGGAGRSGICSPLCGRGAVQPNRLEEEFRALGIPFWPSQANFVLARIGPRHADFVRGMRARGILVRDRSRISAATAAFALPQAGRNTRNAFWARCTRP